MKFKNISNSVPTGETFRMLLKRRIVRRAIWLLSHREITLERGLLVTSSFPGRVHFALVFPFASIGLVIARNAIIILSYDNGVISQSGAAKNVECPRGKNSRSENVGA